MAKVAGIPMVSKPSWKSENYLKAVKLVQEAASQGAEIICLPELWLSGYHFNREDVRLLADTAESRMIGSFQQLAKETKSVLIVPFLEMSYTPSGYGSNYFISSAIIDNNGKLLGIYRKSLLWGQEEKTFTPGKKSYPVFKTGSGTVGVLICYDIEFPEPARELALKGADIIFAPSVWSLEAENRWDIQLPCRALDNTVYIFGVNAAGNGACGKSKLVSPEGSVMSEAPSDKEKIIYGDITCETLKHARSKIPYLKDYSRAFQKGKGNNP
ncbi:nitrilase-related carbon-nitrogen hydrolase [Salipaludibacillus aurantiacus]|uniref:Predicted amidohydrolase n=1 Tax=Salipaludibacillus aurantiacus TaxID=1601833 RepID=A0A1H9TGG8_9BACI|nr:nitrilase-related carbon-nitrogen hydrolase [Salipaludibacillus aurantiacus]SER95929.1 Predicted amidohydrolase [Salipaludibacillus aurantiacus]